VFKASNYVILLNSFKRILRERGRKLHTEELDDLYASLFNSGDQIIADDKGEAYITYGGEKYTGLWGGNMNKRKHSEGLSNIKICLK
jgi:hypothetical protein